MTFISEKGVKEIADRIQRNKQIWYLLKSWSNVQEEEIDSWVIKDSSKVEYSSLKIVRAIKSEVILEQLQLERDMAGDGEDQENLFDKEIIHYKKVKEYQDGFRNK
jgi:hypothetical protein